MGAAAQFSGVEAMRQNPLLLTPEAGFVPAEMPGLRKAAILMVAIGDELAKTLFQSLSETDVQRVTDEITRLGRCSGGAVDAGADGVLWAAGDAAVHGARRSGLCDEVADGGVWRRDAPKNCCNR